MESSGYKIEEFSLPSFSICEVYDLWKHYNNENPPPLMVKPDPPLSYIDTTCSFRAAIWLHKYSARGNPRKLLNGFKTIYTDQDYIKGKMPSRLEANDYATNKMVAQDIINSAIWPSYDKFFTLLMTVKSSQSIDFYNAILPDGKKVPPISAIPSALLRWLDVRYDEEGGETIELDHYSLKQVFLELLAPRIKYANKFLINKLKDRTFDTNYYSVRHLTDHLIEEGMIRDLALILSDISRYEESERVLGHLETARIYINAVMTTVFDNTHHLLMKHPEIGPLARRAHNIVGSEGCGGCMHIFLLPENENDTKELLTGARQLYETAEIARRESARRFAEQFRWPPKVEETAEEMPSSTDTVAQADIGTVPEFATRIAIEREEFELLPSLEIPPPIKMADSPTPPIQHMRTAQRPPLIMYRGKAISVRPYSREMG